MRKIIEGTNCKHKMIGKVYVTMVQFKEVSIGKKFRLTPAGPILMCATFGSSWMLQRRAVYMQGSRRGRIYQPDYYKLVYLVEDGEKV